MQVLIQRFCARLGEADSTLQTAWESGDFEALAKTACSLKGAAGTLGFDSFTETAEELESAAKTESQNLIPELLHRIHNLIARVQKGAGVADTGSDVPARTVGGA